MPNTVQCIVCHRDIEPTDNYQGPICDMCRDGDEFAADRARLIVAAGDLTDEELFGDKYQEEYDEEE